MTYFMYGLEGTLSEVPHTLRMRVSHALDVPFLLWGLKGEPFPAVQTHTF